MSVFDWFYFISSCNDLRKRRGYKSKAMALFVANLFHAMAEKAFITPADPISFFMMIMIFGTLYGNGEIQSKK